jgi:hypothetical protein
LLKEVAIRLIFIRQIERRLVETFWGDKAALSVMIMIIRVTLICSTDTDVDDSSEAVRLSRRPSIRASPLLFCVSFSHVEMVGTRAFHV